VFRLVFPVLARVPIEAGFGHAAMVSRNQPNSHIKVWLLEGLGPRPLTAGAHPRPNSKRSAAVWVYGSARG